MGYDGGTKEIIMPDEAYNDTRDEYEEDALPGEDVATDAHDDDGGVDTPVLLIILVVLLVAGAFLLTGGFFSSTPESDEPGDEVSVSYTDLDNASTLEERLPEGFPTDLPIDSEAIEESYNVRLGGSDQKTLSYVTDSAFDDVVDVYLRYINNNGYEIEYMDNEGAGEFATFAGVNSEGQLEVVVTPANPEGTQTRVHLSYIPQSS